ncbi:MAG: formylglycine-generating enzyme family protein [Flammeovirgaceae bacterium]|nr:formylglycine-generating enzyme family protein [Flammeovirgaceae bacterium]
MKAKIKKYLEETMVFVEGGEFLMGSNKYDSEKPIHKVELSSFEICKYPVTQELYEWVTGENPSHFKGKQRPVEQVDWYDAVEFCNVLSEKLGLEVYYRINKEKKDQNNPNEFEQKKWLVEINGNSKGYRLPSEAEWEFSSKGGTKLNDKFKFSGGNKLNELGWYSNNSHNETKEVGLKKPNKLGLYDMSGNIWEWCWDWYDEDYYYSPQTNPLGSVIGSSRIIRGGAWGDGVNSCRVTYRGEYVPMVQFFDQGFRLSRTV